MIRWNESKESYDYFDANGNEIREDMFIKEGNEYRLLYATEDGTIGTDSTNPSWVKSGRAIPCEYGIYSLTQQETEDCIFYRKEYLDGIMYLVSLDGTDRVLFDGTENDEVWQTFVTDDTEQMKKEYKISYSDISSIRVMLYEMVEMTDGKDKKKEIFDVITKLCMLKEV